MPTLFARHFEALETVLLALHGVSANAGHPIHVGYPREVFIREFLTDHHPRTVDFGTGEVIDSATTPDEARNQHDIVVHYREYPRILFGGSICAYLVESVVATIEVKSTVTKESLYAAMDVARKTKALTPQPFNGSVTGFLPPSIKNFLVAYEGPASMETIAGWVREYQWNRKISQEYNNTPWSNRTSLVAPGLDGVFVIGKGMVFFENNHLTLRPNEPSEAATPKWTVVQCERGCLAVLFVLLTEAAAAKFGRAHLGAYFPGLDITKIGQF